MTPMKFLVILYEIQPNNSKYNHQKAANFKSVATFTEDKNASR